RLDSEFHLQPLQESQAGQITSGDAPENRAAAVVVMDRGLRSFSLLLVTAEYLLPALLLTRADPAARTRAGVCQRRAPRDTDVGSICDRSGAREFSFSHLSIFTHGEISATRVRARDESRMACRNCGLLQIRKLRRESRTLFHTPDSLDERPSQVHGRSKSRVAKSL